MNKPLHARLSEALCEAVEFGHPTLIRIGHEAMLDLVTSIDSHNWHKMERCERFEGVPIKRESGFQGCVVEHDNRYTGLSLPTIGDKPVPETVAMMRDTHKPAIRAW